MLGLVIVGLLQSPTAAAADLAADIRINCVATHEFACGSGDCGVEDVPFVGGVRVYLDLQTGIGSLGEYSQSRDFVAFRFGGDMVWQAQLVIGPSNAVLHQAYEGREVEEEALLPTLGAQLSVDLAASRFLLSEPSGITLFGYFGTCEAETSE
jgi:hypothetical protein